MFTQWKPDNVVYPALSFSLMIIPEWRAEFIAIFTGNTTLHSVIHSDNVYTVVQTQIYIFLQCMFKKCILLCPPGRDTRSQCLKIWWQNMKEKWVFGMFFNWRHWQREGNKDVHSTWFSTAVHIMLKSSCRWIFGHGVIPYGHSNYGQFWTKQRVARLLFFPLLF